MLNLSLDARNLILLMKPLETSNDARAFALAMLNSSLDDAETIPYLDAIVAQGYTGVCPHPRDGFRVPYLSRAYWNGLDRFVSAARERNLAVWFYDEFPFPSGMAGGIVIDEMPEGCVRALRFEAIETELNSDGLIVLGNGKLVALLRINGDEVTDVKEDSGPHLDTWVWGEWHNRYYTGTINVHEELHERGCADRMVRAYLPASPLTKDERLVAVWAEVAKGRRGQIGMPDVSRPEVTKLFLELTYQPYAELARKHGLEQVPMFQDEVTFGTAWPWNKYIERRLRQTWGEHFARNLAALDENREDWESARADYRAACRDQIEEGWFKQVQDLCAANNLRATGHLPGEESILGHCQFMGDAFKMLRRFDIPGYDIISSTLPDGINRGQATGAKIVQSVAWQQSKSTMVEAFGANGFHLDNQKSRSVLAWLACHDLWRIFDHSAYISANGPRKYDAPPLSTRFNPMSVGREDLWNWHSWLCDLFEEYKFAPRTLVLFPVESLARYTLGEEEQWKAEGSLLETWFHTLCAASLDCVFLPADKLHEVQMEDESYLWNNCWFETFLVPPVVSMHEKTLAQLESLLTRNNFHWSVQSTVEFDRTPLKTFGTRDGETQIEARNLHSCSETELLKQGARWFDKMLPRDANKIASSECTVQTVRRNDKGETLRVVINPHDRAIEVECETAPGEVLVAPGEVARRIETNKFELAPREILVLLENNHKVETNKTQTEEVQCSNARVILVGDNALSLVEGTTHLEGESTRAFRPEPVSSLWELDVTQALSDAVYAAPYSRDAFPQPKRFRVEFAVELEQAVETLSLVLDSDSMPPGARVMWNKTELAPQTRAVFDTLNSVFQIPVSQAGTHCLEIEAEVEVASHGVLERPILVGRFLVRNGKLRAMKQDAQSWNGESFDELGSPEGFGPVEYRWTFEVEKGNYVLELPQAIGVAEVWANDLFIGRSNWQPRRLAIGEVAGKVEIRARLHGSWNNLFSRLNRIENGFKSNAILREI